MESPFHKIPSFIKRFKKIDKHTIEIINKTISSMSVKIIGMVVGLTCLLKN